MASKRKTNKIAFSSLLNGYIKCISYRGSTEWDYVMCDENGNVIDNIVRKATSCYSFFDWKDCEA